MNKQALSLGEIGKSLSDFAQRNREPLIGSLAGTAVGGGIGALTADTSLDKTPEEKAQHRLRNALTGGAAGGVIGWNVPGVAHSIGKVMPDPNAVREGSILGKTWDAINPLSGSQTLERGIAQSGTGALGGAILGGGFGKAWQRTMDNGIKSIDDLISRNAKVIQDADAAAIKKSTEFLERVKARGAKITQNGYLEGRKLIDDLHEQYAVYRAKAYDDAIDPVSGLVKDPKALKRKLELLDGTFQNLKGNIDQKLVTLENGAIQRASVLEQQAKVRAERIKSNVKYPAAKSLDGGAFAGKNVKEYDKLLNDYITRRHNAGNLEKINPWSALNREGKSLKVPRGIHTPSRLAAIGSVIGGIAAPYFLSSTDTRSGVQ